MKNIAILFIYLCIYLLNIKLIKYIVHAVFTHERHYRYNTKVVNTAVYLFDVHWLNDRVIHGQKIKRV